MGSLVDFIILVAVVGVGLAILSAKWPKYWKPVLGAYLQVLKVASVVMLYGVYYGLRGIARLIQLAGKALGKGGKDGFSGNRERRRGP